MRLLAVTTKERTPFLPDAARRVGDACPATSFRCGSGCSRRPRRRKQIVDKLAAEIGKAVQEPATKKRYLDIKVDAVGSTPEQFDTFFREQLKFNEDIIKSANIQQD